MLATATGQQTTICLCHCESVFMPWIANGNHSQVTSALSRLSKCEYGTGLDGYMVRQGSD